MKLFNHFVLVSLFFKTMLVSLSAQHIELGFTSKASAGSLYGPVYRAQPIIKWGENFQNLRTVKLDRTYLHYSQFGGNRYGSASLGGFLGLERRKTLTKDFFFFHGPELGGHFTTTGPFVSIQPRARYQLGLLVRITNRMNIAVGSPISTGISIERTEGQWNQTLFTFDIFNDMSNLSITYLL